MTARVELASTRDLRDYGDSTTLARAVGAARGARRRRRRAGTGTHRAHERADPPSALRGRCWFRPRAEAVSTYDMRRDPHNEALAADGAVLARRWAYQHTLCGSGVGLAPIAREGTKARAAVWPASFGQSSSE